jgi:hypothetical protein
MGSDASLFIDQQAGGSPTGALPRVVALSLKLSNTLAIILARRNCFVCGYGQRRDNIGTEGRKNDRELQGSHLGKGRGSHYGLYEFGWIWRGLRRSHC